MTFPTKVHLHKLNLTCPKDLQLLKKRYPRIGSIHIPMKGSSSLSDFSIETALKASKPSSHEFKMLRKIQVPHISDGLLKFFSKNKQVLKGIRSLSAGIGSLPSDKTVQFSRLINHMQYLQKIDDLAKFSVREVMKQRGFTFKPPHKLTSKPLGGNRAAIKGDHALCLKKVYPFRHVQEIQFSPHLNVKRLFPHIKEVAIEVMFLDKLSEVKKAKPTDLVVTDYKSFALASEPNWEALKQIQTLENLTISLTEPENADLSKIISNLPKRELNLSMNFDFDILVSNEEHLSKLVEFINETNSKGHFNSDNLPKSQDFSKVIQTIYHGRCQKQITFSKLVLDVEYSLELQRQVWDSFVHSQNNFDDVLIKVNMDDAIRQDCMIGPYVQTAHDLEEMDVLSSKKKDRDSKFIIIQEGEANLKASSE